MKEIRHTVSPALAITLAITLQVLWGTSCTSKRQYQQGELREFQHKESFESAITRARLPLLQKETSLRDNQITAVEHRTSFGSHLEFNFLDLTAEQKSKILEFYKTGGQSWSMHTADHISSHAVMTDFLPPLIQATVGLLFSRQTEDISEVSLEATEQSKQCIPTQLETVTNCWGTTWEFLRLVRTPHPTNPPDKSPLPSLSVFYIDGQEILKQLRDETHSRLIAQVKEPSEHRWEQPVDLKNGVRPGDALLIIQKSANGLNDSLVHTAIALDAGLYFQKVGIENHALYQIVYLEDIMEKYGIHSGREVTLEWRRYEKEPLPSAQELWGVKTQTQRPLVMTDSSLQGMGHRLLDIPLLYDASLKRAKLTPEAFDTRTFLHDQDCGDSCMRCLFHLDTDDGELKLEVPRISDTKDTVALIPSGFSNEPNSRWGGTLLRRTDAKTFQGKWNCRIITLRFESQKIEGVLDLSDLGMSRTSCRRLHY